MKSADVLHSEKQPLLSVPPYKHKAVRESHDMAVLCVRESLQRHIHPCSSCGRSVKNVNHSAARSSKCKLFTLRTNTRPACTSSELPSEASSSRERHFQGHIWVVMSIQTSVLLDAQAHTKLVEIELGSKLRFVQRKCARMHQCMYVSLCVSMHFSVFDSLSQSLSLSLSLSLSAMTTDKSVSSLL